MTQSASEYNNTGNREYSAGTQEGSRASASNTSGRTASEASNESCSDFRRALQDLGESLKRSSTDAFCRFSTVGQKVYDEACVSTKAGADRLNTEIHRSPLVAVGIALGIGALLGTSLARRS